MKTIITRSGNKRGGDTVMKRAIVLAIFAVMVLGACAVASETVQNYFAAGLNFMSVPLIPLNSDPAAVFCNELGNPIDIESRLTRFDPAVGYIDYSPYTTDFGGMLLGDGCLFQSQGTWVKYTGVNDGIPDGTGQLTDVWISLPGYLNFVGQPFNHSTMLVNMKVTDGTQTLSWIEAGNAHWIDPVATGYNASGYYDVGTDEWLDYQSFDKWCGYLVRNTTSPFKPLALIIPAQ